MRPTKHATRAWSRRRQAVDSSKDDTTAVTPNEEALIRKFVGEKISKDDFLNQMDETDGSTLGLRLLNDAIYRRNADDFE